MRKRQRKKNHKKYLRVRKVFDEMVDTYFEFGETLSFNFFDLICPPRSVLESESL